MKRYAFLILGILALAAPAAGAGFSDWAAIVVSGDSFAHSGKRSAVFDNGRTAIARELTAIGFRAENIRQFSDRPKKYRDGHPAKSTNRNLARGLAQVVRKVRGGCLAYLTSHGDDQGIGVGDDLLSPRRLAQMIDQTCRGRPAVVIVSACYSGVFVDKLKAPNRIVLTAAAKDRSSFGCGETDHYTFFDTCTVANLTAAGDFATFGKKVIACVAAREKQEKVDQLSNPQLAVGNQATAVIPRWKPSAVRPY